MNTTITHQQPKQPQQPQRQPSLKRSLGEMMSQSEATKSSTERDKFTNLGVAKSGFSGERFANGQVEGAPEQFAFVTVRATTLVHDEADTSSCSTSDVSGASDHLDEEDAESAVKPVPKQPQKSLRGILKTAPLFSISSISSEVMTDIEIIALRNNGYFVSDRRKALLKRSSLLTSASTPSLRSFALSQRVPGGNFENSDFPCSSSKTEPLRTIVNPLQRGKGTVNPDEFLRLRMQENGYKLMIVKCTEVTDFFLSVTDESVYGYDMELVTRVREEDIEGLRALLKAGRSMQCSNRFGDSIVHMACRRGSVAVLEFLFNEASVACNVCCDGGRTPLHDACWTSTPNFGIVRLLLEHCPDLLYITDKRGFTPLNYTRQSHWTAWKDFLKSYPTDKLAAKHLWLEGRVNQSF